MNKIENFELLNEKYSQFLMEKISGEKSVTVNDLRKLAKEADIEDVDFEASDAIFLSSLKSYFKMLINLT